MRRTVSLILALWPSLCQAEVIQLPPHIVTENSVEVCLNSRYSQHSLRGTPTAQQLSNILWAAGRAPFIGSYRDIYLATKDATYSYDPNSHTLSLHSSDTTDDGAFAIIYDSELDFDTGVSFMPALLASVSLCNSTESAVASCPKGLGYPKTRLIFGVQPGRALTANLAVRSSVPRSEPGWLPDPCTASDNSLEEVLANLKYVGDFSQRNLTPQQISQILWAGYGCTDHTPSGKAGLTVPSAWANYYLTGRIYLVNESGIYRYHNRNPATNLSSRDHRLEDLSHANARGRGRPDDTEDEQQAVDITESLRSAVTNLPEAPCYIMLCLDSSQVGQEFPGLEVGFVAGNMLIQASALDLGCHLTSKLTADEQRSIQNVTRIPSSHIPQAIVSIGPIDVLVSISVFLQGAGHPDTGWAIPLNVRFFAPEADVLNDIPLYDFDLPLARSDDAVGAAVCEASSITPGTYDVAAHGRSTLMNVRRNVVIASPATSIDMGTLLEGDANQDGTVNLDDYALLSACWLASDDQMRYDVGRDFDRNGLINLVDLGLMSTNWLRGSPIEVPPCSEDSSVSQDHPHSR